VGSEKVLENFSWGSWKVQEKSWIFASKRVGTLCSADTVLCDDIRVYANIYGGSLDSRHQMRVVLSKIAIFASCGQYIFTKFIYETKIIMSEYVVPQWLFINIETDDLE